MLTIRTEQQEILAKASFEAWLVDHARRFFAEQCKERGSEGAFAFVREMVERARGHGLTDGPDISSYIDLAFTFGGDFDSACPWAESILSAAEGRASVLTMDLLHEAAMDALDPEAARAAEAARLAAEAEEYSGPGASAARTQPPLEDN